MVETLPSSAWGAGSIPGRGAGIPHGLRSKGQSIKQKQYCNKFNKDFKKMVHIKKKNLEKVKYTISSCPRVWKDLWDHLVQFHFFLNWHNSFEILSAISTSSWWSSSFHEMPSTFNENHDHMYLSCIFWHDNYIMKTSAFLQFKHAFSCMYIHVQYLWHRVVFLNQSSATKDTNE